MISSWLPARFATVMVVTLFLAHVAHAADSPAVEVPFEWDHSSIRVEVEVDGHRLSMLLDTGWHPITIDDSTARAVGLHSSRSRGSTVRLGGVTARRVPFDVTDLRGINPPGSARYQGVLGCSFLRDRIVQIDYAARVLRFLSGPPALGQRTRTRVPFRFGPLGCLPIVDSVRVNGVSLRGEIDTGAALSFLITPAATRAIGLEDSLRGMRAARSGYFDSGASRTGSARLGRLRSVELGDIRLENVSAVFGGQGEGLMDQPLEVWGVLIGNRFLADYLVTLDFRRRELLLDR